MAEKDEKAPSQCMGPDYRSDGDKPTATVSKQIPHDTVHILPQTPQLIALLTWVCPFTTLAPVSSLNHS